MEQGEEETRPKRKVPIVDYIGLGCMNKRNRKRMKVATAKRQREGVS